MNLPLKTAAPAFALKEVRIADHALLRVNCLPAELLQSLCSPAMASAIEDLLAAEAALGHSRQTVLDALERSVPLAADKRLRRLLLEFRRDVFGGRRRAPKPELLSWLQGVLPAEAREVLATLLAANGALEAASAEMSRQVEAEPARITAILDEALAQPGFVHGLQAAAPRLAEQVARRRHTLPAKERRRLDHSLFAYVARSSSKTSPFSTLTSSVPVATRPGTAGARARLHDDWRLQPVAALNRGFATALRAAIAERDPDLLGGLALHPGLLAPTDEAHLQHHRHDLRRGTFWLEQYVAPRPLELEAIDCLRGLASPFSVDQGLSKLVEAGLDASEARKALRRMQRRDLLRTPEAWNAHTRAPSQALARLLRCNAAASTSGPLALSTADALERMQALAEGFPLAPASDRCSRAQRIREEFETVHATWSNAAPPDLRTPVFEDGWLAEPPVEAGEALRAIIERVSRVVASKVTLSREYAWLRDRFVAIHGEGGTCTDVPAFCRRAWTELQAMHRNPPAESSGDLPPIPARVPLTLFVQLDAGSIAEFDDPECGVVLNLAYNRIGWQAFRLTGCANSDEREFASSVRDWLHAAHAPREPVAIHVSGACNNLQAGDRVSTRVLELEGPPSNDGDLSLGDLVLRHDCESGLLDVTDRDGRALALSYLGSAVPMAAWGPRFVPILMAEPFDVGRPPPGMLFTVATDDDFVRHQPRWEEDGVVLLRETWWIRSSQLLALLAGLSPGAQVEAMCRLAREHGMPLTAYVSGQPAASGTSAGAAAFSHRKPCWTDLRVGYCIEELSRIAAQVEWLVVRESYPDLPRQWLTRKGKGFVSEFMVEVVLHGELSR
jgi:hypothetical protein